MTLLYIFMAVVIGAVVFWWWQGVSSLNSLERGEHGPFTVTRTSGSGDSYLSWDATNRKLALVNNSVPEFNARGDLTNHRNMTVVFSLDEIEGVSVTRDESVATVNFSFIKQIPAWNIRKQLSYVSGPEIRTFFEKYVPELKVGYYKRSKYGGVEPW